MSKILKLFLADGLIPFLDSKRNNDHFSAGNTHMFQEDVSQHKMPYNERLERFPNFKITITGNDKEQAKEALKSLSNHRHSYSDTDLLCDVINNVSRTTYHFGRIYLCKRIDVNGKNEFVEIYPHNIFRLFKLYLQFIPKSDRQNTSIYFRFEKSENIFCLSVFKKLFSRIKFKLIEILLSFTDGVFPKFFMEDQFQNRHFETSCYKKIEVRFMSLVTKEYAWTLRFLAEEHSNEYFQIYSSYLSAIRNAKDREVLLEQLNEMFHHFKIDALLTLEGIPTSHELTNSLFKLKSGEKTFRHALDEIYLR